MADLWWFMVVLGSIAFVVFAVGLAIGLRRSAGSSTGDRRRRGTSTAATRAWILGGGVVLPTLVVVLVFGATILAMRDIEASDDEPELTIEVVGHQFWWEVRYPDHGVVTANEVHVPANTQVELALTSSDVIHSFWVPAVGGKLDLLPERVNRLVIDAEPGTYDGRCAEFCGTSHANMDFLFVAHDDDGFARWLAEQRASASVPATGSEAAGAELFLDAGCAACHTVAGTEAAGTEGPDLTHMATRQSILGGAADATVPDLVEWITDPHSLKPGAKMPPTDLDDEEVDDLVAYLLQLR